MTMQHAINSAQLATFDDEHAETDSVGAIVRSEVDAQLSAAHKYPRSIATFLSEATTMATMTQEIAESCMYSVPRDGKTITGPSVRLAEICASAYGNLHVGSRTIDETETNIVAQGVAWDLQKNLRVSVETRRRITGRNGKRYSKDLITMTGNAAASIALRNAIFRVVPRAYVDMIYDRARIVAIGDAKTLVDRRTTLMERLLKMGITRERVLTRVEKPGVEDIGLQEIEVLIGLGTAIKNGDSTADEAFPEVPRPGAAAEGNGAPAPAAPSEDGKRISMKGKKADPATEAHDKVTGEMPPLTDAEKLRREVAEQDAADRKAEGREPGSDG